VDLDQWISHPTDGGVVNLIAHKQGESCSDIIKKSLLGAEHIRLLVGPEGGLSEDELTRLDHTQAIMVSLGEGVLRVEAAAVALTALVGRLPVVGRTGSQPAAGSV
jgi:16S rRNA (uracil1498-N3)-methyltransferase